MNRRRSLAAAALLATAALGALAQTTIYRCGADGRTFSQAPCPDGREIALARGPSAQAQAEARAVAAREAALARRLTEERPARDVRAARQSPWIVAQRTPSSTATKVDAAGVPAERASRRAKVPKAPNPASGR